ncbi:MAG: heme lyase CcmF/NrfE family subunit [Oligoflexus sp.]
MGHRPQTTYRLQGEAMFANYGFFLLFLCFIICSYGFLASIGAAKWRHKRLYRSSKMALTMTAVLCVLAVALLVWSFFQRDYSIAYIMKNSSNDLPAIFTFTALWSSLEGSHTFWTMLLAIVGAIAVWTPSKDNEHIMPYVAASFQAVLAWMFYLAITHSDPFVWQLPTPSNGRGMNELLQNPYMAIHPPMLFLGYVCLGVPFAYSMAALCYGDITEGWLKTVRRWNLFAWVLLTASITLGGRWAYVELGWAGYWAWDPVENSSFLPWLMSTALIHSLLVQDKLGHLKRLSIILGILGFFLTYFGTFLTRSGVVSSVHSFAESPIGPNYLMYLSGFILVSTAIYAFRAPSILPADTNKVWGVSKESALVVTQFLVISFAAIVFVGTMFPIVSEAITSQRISVQQPYFNTFAPWVGLGFIVMIAIGNLMHYQTPKMPGAKKVILISAATAIPMTVVLAYFGSIWTTTGIFAYYAQIVGFYLCSWSIGCIFGDFYLKLKNVRFQYKLFFSRNLAYVGGFIAHLGILIAIIGFLGNYRSLEKKVTLLPSQSTELFGYQFQLGRGIEMETNKNATLFIAPLTLTRDGKTLDVMKPAQAVYPTKTDQTFNEIAVYSELWNDVYVVLADFDRETGARVTFQLHINPTVKVVWIAIILMCIGGLVAMFDRFRGNRSRDVVASQWEVER